LIEKGGGDAGKGKRTAAQLERCAAGDSTMTAPFEDAEFSNAVAAGQYTVARARAVVLWRALSEPDKQARAVAARRRLSRGEGLLEVSEEGSSEAARSRANGAAPVKRRRRRQEGEGSDVSASDGETDLSDGGDGKEEEEEDGDDDDDGEEEEEEEGDDDGEEDVNGEEAGTFTPEFARAGDGNGWADSSNSDGELDVSGVSGPEAEVIVTQGEWQGGVDDGLVSGEDGVSPAACLPDVVTLVDGGRGEQAQAVVLGACPEPTQDATAMPTGDRASAPSTLAEVAVLWQAAREVVARAGTVPTLGNPSDKAKRLAARAVWPPSMAPSQAFWLPLLKFAVTGSPSADCVLLQQHFGERFTAVATAYAADFARRGLRVGLVGDGLTDLTKAEVDVLFKPGAVMAMQPLIRSAVATEVCRHDEPTAVPVVVYDAAMAMTAVVAAGRGEQPVGLRAPPKGQQALHRKRAVVHLSPAVSPLAGPGKRAAPPS